MTDIIHLLPESIANQIAAGEVVQRPSSVVKELIENAIDAGAQSIQVIIKDAGKSLIQVIDDGTGMTLTDARMSFERHATSKIRKSEDLFKITTMGFRGEALASVAAVSHVEQKTRVENEELGTSIIIEGSKIKSNEPIATIKGTSIEVKNLFYNVPARRNFLKSNSVEMRHIIDEFQRASLGRPDISYRLFQNDMEIYNLPAGKLVKRIVNLFGKNYQSQLVVLEEKTPHLEIHGYIGKPEFAKKTRGEQFIFVNKRYIKNNYLNHAIQIAYENLLAKDYYPFFVLFLEIDPGHIDVNVHPTKTEIKFIDERTIYGIIKATIKQSLGQHNITPSIDYSTDVNLDLSRDFGGAHSLRTSTDLDYERFRLSGREQSNLKNWENLFEKEGLPESEFIPNESPYNKSDERIILESRANNREGLEDSPQNFNQVLSTYQVHGKYILSQVKSGIMFINQVAAHQRIVYEKYLNVLLNNSGTTQRVLFPITIELNPADYSLAMDIKDEIVALGFDFDIFGNNSLVINGIPADITSVNEKEVFEGLIEQYKLNKEKLELKTKENLAMSMARYTSLKEGKVLNLEEQKSIIDQLFGCKNPNYSPFGESTYFILGIEQVENKFKKRN